MAEETNNTDEMNEAGWDDAVDNSEMEQGDIDALFTSGANQEKTYDNVIEQIINESVANYDRLPMLDIVFDRLIMMVTASLKRLTTANSDINLNSISSMRYNEAMGTIPLPGLLAVVDADPWGGQFVIALDAPMLYASFELMLGGRKASPAKPEGRNFTSIERRLAGKLMETLLSDLQEAFSPLCQVNFSIERIEANPQFATVAQANSPSVHAVFNAKMDDRPGQFEFILPYGTIDPIRSILQKVFLGEKLGGDPAWEKHLQKEMQSANVRLEAKLHEFEIKLGDILSWEKGQTLELYIPSDHELRVSSGNVDLFSTKIGQNNGHLAVKVEDDLDGKEDMVNALVNP